MAAGKQMIVMSVGDDAVRRRSVMPAMHTDDIRDLQVRNPLLSLSDGVSEAGICVPAMRWSCE